MLIGHQPTVATLSQLLASGKLPHAILLTGPQGIGKATLATHLAERLICGAGQGATPANPFAANQKSPQYSQLQAGSCPDFHRLTLPEKRKTIPIEDVRSLLTTLNRSADTQRVAIIDSLDILSPDASNTLLKSLEEPRPGITFLLIAHSLAQVLPTIRSRCRLIRMAPLSLEQTEQVLDSLDKPTTLAKSAHGCPGQVLQPTDPLQKLLSEAAQKQGFAAAQTYQQLFALSQSAKALNLPKEDVLTHANNIAGQ